MPTGTRKVPPLPAPDVQLVERDGTINPDWYKWLVAVAAIIRELRLEIP